MKHIRRGLNPVKVPFAMRTADPVMRDWIGETREAIRNLAARLPQAPRAPYSSSAKNWRFKVSFNSTEQKLHVGEGSVAWQDANQPDSVTRPFIPKLDGTTLTDNPSWDISGKSPGTEYEVICIYRPTSGRMVLHEKDGEEELEMENDERARLIATVKFEANGSGLKIEELEQRWKDDIEHGGDEWVSSSGSNDGDSGDDSDGDDSGDDSDIPDDSDGSGESDSDGSDSSSSGSCCPEVTITDVLLDTGDPSGCLPVSGPGMTETITAFITGEIGDYDCPDCASRLVVEFGIGGTKQSMALGQNGSGMQFSGFFEITVRACSTVTAWAQIKKFGGTPGGDGCSANNCERVTMVVQIPGGCPDGECSEDSSSDSSEPESDSETPTEPCNCDFRIDSKSRPDPQTAILNVKNHGTCAVRVYNIYAEVGGNGLYDFDPDVTSGGGTMLAPDAGLSITITTDSPNTLSGVLCEVRAHCLTPSGLADATATTIL